jgi:hypothetical protein
MKLSAHDIRRLAVESRRDPRTVKSVVEGRPARDMATLDIREAADRLGISIDGEEARTP